jgi:ElaB/YqjD/DUF883 family membrane-anchored ribosome-binding protein
MMEHTAETNASLADELRNVLTQAEALLRAIGDDSDATLAGLRERVHESIDTAKARLADIEAQAGQMSQRAAVAAESWVRENPWTTVALCVSVGLVIGTIIGNSGRRSSRERRDSDE